MKNKSVCILDYGSGNVRSVYNLFCSIAMEVTISNDLQCIENATHLVLPGVGAFGSTMEKIKAKLPLKLLEREVLIKKKPFLGICVGMQVLATKGIEFGTHDGINWISGTVQELEAKSFPLPHVGWNDIIVTKPDKLLDGLDKHNDFYFVHKYACHVDDPANIVAHTEYGTQFCSIIRKENIIGVQFHPEKSQQAGRKLASNFLAFT